MAVEVRMPPIASAISFHALSPCSATSCLSLSSSSSVHRGTFVVAMLATFDAMLAWICRRASMSVGRASVGRLDSRVEKDFTLQQSACVRGADIVS